MWNVALGVEMYVAEDETLGEPRDEGQKEVQGVIRGGKPDVEGPVGTALAPRGVSALSRERSTAAARTGVRGAWVAEAVRRGTAVLKRYKGCI